jgi:predicted nucleotidyltransferase
MNQEMNERLHMISERLKREYQAEQVILYGSHTTGEATEDSDVDLFIIAPTKERFFERMATVLRMIRDLKRGVPIEPVVLTKEEVEERIRIGDQFVQGIIEQGIHL